MADIPHLAFPLRFNGATFTEVEQQSGEHLMQQAEIVVRTRPQTLEAQPEFGLRNLIGTSVPVGPPVVSALKRFIPDHEYAVLEDESLIAERIRQVAIDLGVSPGADS